MKRWRYLFCMLLILGLSCPVFAQESPVIATAKALGAVSYIGYQVLGPTSTPAVGLTVPTGATMAFISVETAPMRFWPDGTVPTSSTGHLVNAGDMILLNSKSQLDNFKIIAVSTTGSLMISYGKP